MAERVILDISVQKLSRLNYRILAIRCVVGANSMFMLTRGFGVSRELAKMAGLVRSSYLTTTNPRGGPVLGTSTSPNGTCVFIYFSSSSAQCQHEYCPL